MGLGGSNYIGEYDQANLQKLMSLLMGNPSGFDINSILNQSAMHRTALNNQNESWISQNNFNPLGQRQVKQMIWG